MTYNVKDKLENMLLKVSTYVQTKDGGIVDVVLLASEAINYYIEKEIIKPNERFECCEYITLILNERVFNNSIPFEHLVALQNMMMKVNSYSYSKINRFV